MYKILVIEDNIPELDRMSDILSLEGFNSVKAATGEEGQRKIIEESPDLITIDIGLPDMDGMDILAQIRPTFKNPIIMITANKTIDDVVGAMNLGANDYIGKPFIIDEFLNKINKNLKSRKADTSKMIFKTGNMTIDFESLTFRIKEHHIYLTKTEFELMKIFSENQGKALSFEYIVKRIWGEVYETEHNKLRVLISGIRKKISIISEDYEYITTIQGTGFRFEVFPVN